VIWLDIEYFIDWRGLQRQAFQSFVSHARVYLCHANVRPPHDLLKAAGVDPLFDSQRGACVTQNVRRETTLDAGTFFQPADYLVNAISRKPEYALGIDRWVKFPGITDFKPFSYGFFGHFLKI
jgi:hypothetical protein